ncbi:A/G-specific adenine glycosylase [Siccirubricoccus phaeus]|uniref:A/G-specific adenine glycosylase n=1 Tax=Siccirubricoccus phaeus TaxID=2595053 RepID=UPI0011F1C65B|nr:NUDIX domain-containing protein [Siccirubricoccus phaeus]
MAILPPAAALLDWYDRHRRVLPFRATGGAPDPYQVWLSEVMLQQTTVAAVGPRFARFLARFPDVAALAAAPDAAVMEEWAGLGYYARARNLLACARAVAAAGGFPRTAEGLRALPGIGPYTAAAIAAIAFGEAVVPVDGNVERVMARLAAEERPLPGVKPVLAALAGGFMADAAARARPGDFAQALFDLGATICTPRTPACALCPWRGGCVAQRRGVAAELPRKVPKRARPLRHGAHFLLRDAAGQVLLRRRPPRGLLGGMLELPGTPWREGGWETAEALPFAPRPGLRWQAVPGLARHGFTHFELEMRLFSAEVPALAVAEGEELRPLAGLGAALPTVMRRVLGLASSFPPPLAGEG